MRERNMQQPITYELIIKFSSENNENDALKTKDHVKSWLIGEGEESFVEGTVDNLDMEHDYENPGYDYYSMLGGNLSPLSLYKYTLGELETLRERLLSVFNATVTAEIKELETKVWQEGWKESFTPFSTRKFHIYPPWDPSQKGLEKHPVEIEPGMAFGTGHHATTQLCLTKIEDMVDFYIGEGRPLEEIAVLDVGTGSGILAIAALKIGFQSVLGTDIEADAVQSSKNNAKANGVDFRVLKASVPPVSEYGQFDLVIANILAVVLKKILKDLATAVLPGGKLMLSGLLVEEREILSDMGREYGLEEVDFKEQSGWGCLLLEKPKGL
jgi:ribosomal protein L11 methyltransferase